MVKSLLLLSLTLILVGCGGMKEVNIRATPEDKVVINPPPPPQLNMREVKWVLFNREKLEKMLADHPDQEIVLFAISAKGYENLSLNFQEIINYIQDQKGIIIYYRNLFPTPKELDEKDSKDKKE